VRVLAPVSASFDSCDVFGHFIWLNKVTGSGLCSRFVFTAILSIKTTARFDCCQVVPGTSLPIVKRMEHGPDHSSLSTAETRMTLDLTIRPWTPHRARCLGVGINLYLSLIKFMPGLNRNFQLAPELILRALVFKPCNFYGMYRTLNGISCGVYEGICHVNSWNMTLVKLVQFILCIVKLFTVFQQNCQGLSKF
jgi:hypothetical protein